MVPLSEKHKTRIKTMKPPNRKVRLASAEAAVGAIVRIAATAELASDADVEISQQSELVKKESKKVNSEETTMESIETTTAGIFGNILSKLSVSSKTTTCKMAALLLPSTESDCLNATRCLETSFSQNGLISCSISSVQPNCSCCVQQQQQQVVLRSGELSTTAATNSKRLIIMRQRLRQRQSLSSAALKPSAEDWSSGDGELNVATAATTRREPLNGKMRKRGSQSGSAVDTVSSAMNKKFLSADIKLSDDASSRDMTMNRIASTTSTICRHCLCQSSTVPEEDHPMERKNCIRREARTTRRHHGERSTDYSSVATHTASTSKDQQSEEMHFDQTERTSWLQTPELLERLEGDRSRLKTIGEGSSINVSTTCYFRPSSTKVSPQLHSTQSIIINTENHNSNINILVNGSPSVASNDSLFKDRQSVTLANSQQERRNGDNTSFSHYMNSNPKHLTMSRNPLNGNVYSQVNCLQDYPSSSPDTISNARLSSQTKAITRQRPTVAKSVARTHASPLSLFSSSRRFLIAAALFGFIMSMTVAEAALNGPKKGGIGAASLTSSALHHDSSKSPKYISFTDPSTERFIHQTMYDHTGHIYVGAVNKIYQLDENLELQSVATMGPQEDDPWCPVTRSCPTIPKKPLDYYNKVLVIDYVNSRLISCGSLFQGVCSVHRLDNVADMRTPAHESVVANNATASTVGFIGKGPNNQRVLYVGVSYTNNGPYRSDVPAVSSRSLDLANNTFNIAVTGVSTGTRVSVNSLAREFFPIHYVFGFTSKDFSYWLTVQKKFTDRAQPYISKLVRVCQRDVHYYSYTEVALVCKTPEGIDYNLAQAAYVGKPGSELAVSLGISAQDDVLFVVFSKSQDDSDDAHNKASHKSALCVYALSAVHRKFTQNIHHCFNGHGQRGLDFINPSQPCQLTQVQISDDFCGMEVNTPLDGPMPIEATPVLTYPNILLTSVAAISTHDYTVTFMGTSDGHLKKAVVESVTSAFEYSDITLDPGKGVQSDMLFDRDNKYIYVMTEKKITRVNVQECSQFKTCVDCLGAQDPYCGWCSLENKCSLRSDCAQAAQDPLYWLSYKSGKCTTITQVHPAKIQRTTARILALSIGNLPNLEGNFFCAFTTFGKTLETNATKTTNGVQCATPHTDSLPAIPPGDHHFTAKLSVRMRNNPDFVATNFTFYDCSTYASCTECVSSPFPCDWCVGGHRCTHDTGENCRNDVLVTGVASVGPSIRSGPGFCPRIDATNKVPEQLVAMGIQKRIQVKVENIPPFIAQTRFVCQFNIEGRVKQVNAQLLGDTIYCDQMQFNYATTAPNITAAFAVIWEGSKPLDNPENVHVLVYRCASMSENCGMCLELPEKYSCGWCQESNSCEVQQQCHKHNVKWLERTQTCPDPQIVKVTPSSGPLDGGTNITIDGYNLGRVFSDIESGVYIDLAGVQNDKERIYCKPHEALYMKTTRIVCELGAPNHNRTVAGNTISGPVTVKVLNDYTAKSPKAFSFVSPRITSINPSKGPMSGGTKLRIWGLHMDAGSRAEAFVGAMPCSIISRKPNVVECITSASTKNEEGKVRLRLDSGLRTFEDYGFLYVADPEVHQVESGGLSNSGSGHQIRGVPRGIPSGGISVIVKGTHLNSVQEPMMYIALDGVEYYSKCVAESSTEMKCRTPNVPANQLSFVSDENEEFIELEYGFKMDNVQGVRHLSSSKGFPKFQMFPDPSYFPFSEEGGIKYYKSDYLTINGANLDRASQESDVVVRIGASYCNVTSLSRTQLTCRPPSEQPPALDESGHIDRNRIPQVIVEVGDTLRYQIGMLSYDYAPHGAGYENQLSRPIVIGVVCGGVVLIVIVIGILIAYRRKSSESSRVLKTMQEQMDVLELRVASECKEAFAELQTEITDLTSDLTAGGIPYLDYRSYTMKVLFPNVEDHPVLKEMQIDPVEKQYMEKGLRMFGQLIMNKTFLLLFIRTLESNRYFSMRDRVQVASLIMVTLQGKMEYCTDILKTLLAELIEKCIDGKSHPKLLLRRTESVAEKMLSAWFTFLLYKFLRECAGEPLFVLFRAIKQQVDKGPVDAVTSEARYSLSEEKLIRQQVDYKSITAYFSIAPQSCYMSAGMIDSALAEGSEIPVRVLDCDTISQVKERGLDAIYKNQPASMRPCKEDLDLEWRTGTSGRLILSDEDSTTKTEGEWRRLNTLAHYKVPDGASLILVPKQSSMYNLSITSEKMNPVERNLYHRYETLNFTGFNNKSPPMSRAASPPLQGLHDLEGGYKYWHLVRHADADKDERGNKMVSEIYLTRLLATKGTLQKFVDDLFETIFSTAHRGGALPLAIKYMFDFLDDQALQHGIQDPEVVHTWKSNSLPLRFWVNLIKNPNFVFDTSKSNIVDSCLSVVAQTFMDACSTSDHRLGKDSPSSKLLYAKDIPNYKDLVEHYYSNIRAMPAISDCDMNAMLAEESRLHAHEFNTNVALNELYKYAAKYTDQLIQTLEEDEFSQKNRLAWRLSQVNAIMRGDTEA